MKAANSGDKRALLLLVLFSLGLAGWLLASGTRVTREDGFYYFQIARNVARGAGSSFDGLHTTNGYQPLWLLALLPVFRLVAAPEPALSAAIALQALLMTGGAAALYRLARLQLGVPAALLAALIWLALTCRESLGGLEFALNALLLMAAAQLYLTRFTGPAAARLGEAWRLGVLLALAFLARVDNLALAAVVWLALLWRARRADAKSLLAAGLPVAVTVGAYAFTNLRLFGHAFPVSGAVKREWSRHLLELDPNFQAGGYWLAKGQHLLWPLRNLPQRHALLLTLGSAGTGALLLIAALARRADGPRGQAARALLAWAPLGAFSLIQVLGYGLLLHGELSFVAAPWYFVVQPLLASLAAAALAQGLLAALARRARAPRARLLRMLPAAACIGVVLWTVASVRRWAERDALLVTYAAAAWTRASLPEHARIGSWHAGAIGYLSGRTVVNLDGLVNSWEFFESGQRDLCRYWQDTGTEYLVDMFAGTRAAVYAPAYAAYAACADRLERIWLGPAPAGTGWRLAAFRVLSPP